MPKTFFEQTTYITLGVQMPFLWPWMCSHNAPAGGAIDRQNIFPSYDTEILPSSVVNLNAQCLIYLRHVSINDNKRKM